MAERVSRLILTDWAASPRALPRDEHTFANELLLLSLLYDEVLIQDEVLVLWPPIAQWSSESAGLAVLTGGLRSGALRVLSQSLDSYPTAELQDLAVRNPLLARAQYIQSYSTRAAKQFNPSRPQVAFYNSLGSTLVRSPDTIRRVVGFHRFARHDSFPSLLATLISESVYSRWLRSAFPGVTERVKADLQAWITDPTPAREQLPPGQRQVAPGDENLFTRSLGYRLTARYGERERRAAQRLIQTVFAAPFCRDQGATGRYGRGLREVILAKEGIDSGPPGSGALVRVETHVEIPVDFPDIRFSAAEAATVIEAVRQSAEGRELRAAMRVAGKDVAFGRQVAAWRAAAAKLAEITRKRRRMPVHVAVLSSGGNIAVGTVANAIWGALTKQPFDLGGDFGNAFLGSSIGLACEHIKLLLQQDLTQQRYRGAIERAVNWRCVDVLPT